MSPKATGGVSTPQASPATSAEETRTPAPGSDVTGPDPVAQRLPPGLRLVAAVVLAASIGLVGGGLAAWVIYQHFGPVVRIVTAPIKGDTGQGQTVGQLAQSKAGSVVTIATQQVTPAGLLTGPTGFANGFVVGADGLVLTSAHAVQGASRLRIGLSDGRGFDATVAGIDTAHGLVILRAAGASNLPVLSYASTAPAPGDLAIAVSRPPLGTLSLGVGSVSSTGRTIEVNKATATSVADVLTIDASTQPLADGAPVLDAAGQVIGIVTIVTDATPPPGVTALSYSAGHTLSDRAAGAAAATRATLGAEAASLDPATAAAAGLTPGALIRSVDPNGPSAPAGLRAGDIVTAVNGTAIDANHPFDAVALGLQPGEPTTVTVISGGVSRNVSVTVASTT